MLRSEDRVDLLVFRVYVAALRSVAKLANLPDRKLTRTSRISINPMTSVQSSGVSPSEHATTGALRIFCADNTCTSRWSGAAPYMIAADCTIRVLHLTLSA